MASYDSECEWSDGRTPSSRWGDKCCLGGHKFAVVNQNGEMRDGKTWFGTVSMGDHIGER